MINNYKISVIVPNYNCEKYIRDCLMSILNQVFDNFEIIIIDDGSDDNSDRIILETIENQKSVPIRYIRQFNQNAAIARNRGLEIAKGRFVLFLDSDDVLFDNYVLQKVYDDAKNTDLLMGNYCIVDEKSSIIRRYRIEDESIIQVDNKFKYALLSPVPSNKLFRMDIIKDNNLFFDNVYIGQDLNFYLKYLLVAEKIKIVNYDFYKYRILPNSMSRVIDSKILDIRRTFEKIHLFYQKRNHEEDYCIYIGISELFHYDVQMGKIRCITSKKQRKLFYSFFMFCIDSVDRKKIFKDKNYRTIIKKITYKKRLKWIYLSNYYPSLQMILKKIKNSY